MRRLLLIVVVLALGAGGAWWWMAANAPGQREARRGRGKDDPIPILVATAQQLMDANKERFRQVTTGVPRPGEQTWVYGRAGLPCRRCGTVIRRADQGPVLEERVTFWCSHCQPD